MPGRQSRSGAREGVERRSVERSFAGIIRGVLARLKRTFRDVNSDQPLQIGTRGVLTIATRGKDGPGEVQVELNGLATTFIAYCDHPLERGTPVVVYETLGGRKVSVEQLT